MQLQYCRDKIFATESYRKHREKTVTNILKVAILTLLCVSLCAVDVFGEPPSPIEEPNQAAYLKPLSPDKLKQDLDFLFKTIEEVHPNMYAYTLSRTKKRLP